MPPEEGGPKSLQLFSRKRAWGHTRKVGKSSEFAAMLQLKETLDMIAKHYAEQYEQSGYFAAVNKATLFAFAVDSKETGTFTL